MSGEGGKHNQSFYLKKKKRSSLSVPNFAHWGFQASIFPVLTVPSISTSSPQSHKRSTHPLLLSCYHGNHHCVANGESKEEVQVRICTAAASTALRPANPLEQLPVWNHLPFLSASKNKQTAFLNTGLLFFLAFTHAHRNVTKLFKGAIFLLCWRHTATHSEVAKPRLEQI